VTQYIAFLRGVNVGGNSTVNMKQLSQVLSEIGLQDVRTLLNSGNVLCSSDESEAAVCASVENAIRKQFDLNVAVLLRTREEVQSLVASAPFATSNADPDAKPYVVLVREPPAAASMPRYSPNGDVEMSSGHGRDLICWSHQVNGKWGFPNAFVEKTVSAPATTRGWSTILRVVGV
jgi:uncharacterized protein (DUF1697 family)